MTHEHDSHHHGHGGPPTQVLKDEHALILEALDAIERKVAALEAGAAPDRAYFEKAVQFLRTFADQCHHGKEENLLFKTMVDRGFPRQAGPIAVMLYGARDRALLHPRDRRGGGGRGDRSLRRQADHRERAGLRRPAARPHRQGEPHPVPHGR